MIPTSPNSKRLRLRQQAPEITCAAASTAPVRARPPLLPALLLAALGISCLTVQAQTPERKLYCWVKDGRRTCSDVLPAEAVNQEREEFNAKSGFRSGHTQRTLNDEERAVAEAEKAKQQAEDAEEKARKRAEAALLLPYASEQELRKSLNEHTELLASKLRTSRYNMTHLRESLISLLRRAGERELSGKTVPEKLAADIQQLHQKVLQQQQLQAGFEKEQATLTAKIEDSVRRYREIKNIQ